MTRDQDLRPGQVRLIDLRPTVRPPPGSSGQPVKA